VLSAVPSSVCVFGFFGLGSSTSCSPRASEMRVRFFVSILPGFLGASKPRGRIAGAGILSPANERLARLDLGLPSSSLWSLSVADRAETGSKYVSFRGRDVEVDTDPLADTGALEDVGDRAEATEVRGEPDEPFALAAIIGS
jgi:hypothetical protein